MINPKDKIFSSDRVRGMSEAYIEQLARVEWIPFIYTEWHESDFPDEIEHNFPKFGYKLWLN